MGDTPLVFVASAKVTYKDFGNTITIKSGIWWCDSCGHPLSGFFEDGKTVEYAIGLFPAGVCEVVAPLSHVFDLNRSGAM